jgi:streptogramin lyase
MRPRVLLVLVSAAVATAQPYGGGALAGGGVRAAAIADAAWKKAGADAGLRQAFERAAYALEESGRGTYRGGNPAQRLTLEFNGREARLSHPDGSVSFHLSGYGYGDRLQEPARARLTGAGNRVEYHRGDLTEWYVNGSQGLEQGFTLSRRPGTDRENDPLVIALTVSGGLAPAQKTGEGAVRLESGTGVVLRYAGLRAVDARGRVLPSRIEVRGRAIRLIVEDHDAQYPLVADPTWTQQQELTAPDGAYGDNFGTSVSVSRDTAVIGAPNPTGGPGTAYVFVLSGGVWSLQQELTISDGVKSDNFGTSVSVSGDTAVIGASQKQIGSNSLQGAAYAFVRSGGVWTQQQALTASDGAALDEFGWSVSVSGDTAVIGAAQKNQGAGAAYVFVRSGGVWTQQIELGGGGGFFGYSVSVSGDTAVIGDTLYPAVGAAHVFVRSGGLWLQQQILTASDPANGYQFGASVSVTGDTAVIGDQEAFNKKGAAYMFVRSGGVWTQQSELTASDSHVFDYFGHSVSVSGDTAVIGAFEKGIEQGAAYVFGNSGGTWAQQQELTASDASAYDEFGSSVSVSGNTMLIGARYRNTGSAGAGAAYGFAIPGPDTLGTNALLVGSAAGTSWAVLPYSGAWTAAANDSFLHISPGSVSGTGSPVVVFTYDAFTGTGTRTGTMTIAGLTVTVTQAGTNYMGPGPAITLAPSGLSAPHGAAVDGAGNVYIADNSNSTIKEWVASMQQVTSLLSTWSYYPAGVALDGSGIIYIADSTNLAIQVFSPSTMQVSPLVSSGLKDPGGVAVDGSGNVYIADAGNNAIEEWSAATKQAATLVSAGLKHPSGVAVDAFGNVYIADTGNNAIEEWSATTQQVTTLVSSGLNGPMGVAVDGSGNVYIADKGNNAIEEWSAATQQVTTLVSSGLNQPSGVTLDRSGNVYIADTGNNAIKEIPYAFVGPARLTEPPTAGADSLLPVLPSTTSLAGIFAPASDQSWLTLGTIANGVVNFSFTANTSTTPRVAHITVLGQQITVTQAAVTLQSITVTPLNPSIVVGTAQQFAATGTYTDGSTQSLTGQVTWESTLTPVATITGAGKAAGVKVGASSIRATLGSVSGSTTLTVTPLGPCDVTQQGTYTVVDVQTIINETLGGALPVDDLNGDHVVNAVDVQIVVNAVLNLGCTV